MRGLWGFQEGATIDAIHIIKGHTGYSMKKWVVRDQDLEKGQLIFFQMGQLMTNIAAE